MHGTPSQDWMTLAEAAEYARFAVTSPKHPVLAFRRWAKSPQIRLTLYPRGRAELVERKELDFKLKLQQRMKDAERRQRGPRRIAS